MASVSKQPNGRWLVRYWTPDGEQRKCRFDRATDARNFANRIEASKATGTFVDPRAGRTRLSEWARHWLEGVRPDPETGEGPIKPKTFASYESLLRSRVLPALGRRQLASLKPSDVQIWINKMQAEGLSASRVRQAHVLLKQMLDAALRDRVLGTNAALGVKLPRLQQREATFFERGVVDGIAGVTQEPYDVLVIVLGVVGLRFGEAVALRRRHVNLIRRRLAVEDSLAEISGQLIFGRTKTHAVRSVPLPAGLASQLERHLEEQVGSERDELVFTAPEGGPLRYRNFTARVWYPTLKRLGIPQVGVHVLRHSAAARMIAAGASPKAVQKVLGHRSVAFTLTVYGHMFDEDLDDLAARLDISEGTQSVSKLDEGAAQKTNWRRRDGASASRRPGEKTEAGW
jgi:integrase